MILLESRGRRYNTNVDRRSFLSMVAPVAVRDRLAGAVSIPIVDTHIHLFDKGRRGRRYNTNVDRRSFLSMVAPVAVRDRLAGAVSIPIVDTHIHLFDTARPQGVPWPD